MSNPNVLLSQKLCHKPGPHIELHIEGRTLNDLP